MTNYKWPFGTLPFGLFGQIWTQGTLRQKWVVTENQSFLDEGAIIWPLIGLVLGGQVPGLNHGANLFPDRKHLGGCQFVS